MRGSHSKKMPASFDNWLNEDKPDWQRRYSELSGDAKRSVVAALREAQRGLCVYCGRQLSRNHDMYHIEHFRPQCTYPQLDVELENMYLSCGPRLIWESPSAACEDQEDSSATCGVAKENWFDENLHIEPHYPVCTDRFRFELSGCVTPLRNDDRAARAMIEKLNLNHKSLVVRRRRILASISNDDWHRSDFLRLDGPELLGFAHVAFQHLGKVIP